MNSRASEDDGNTAIRAGLREMITEPAGQKPAIEPPGTFSRQTYVFFILLLVEVTVDPPMGRMSLLSGALFILDTVTIVNVKSRQQGQKRHFLSPQKDVSSVTFHP